MCATLCKLIDEINCCRESQSYVDEKYEKLTNVILNEMEEKWSPISTCGRRKNTPFKPYWNEDLSSLWKLAHAKESTYVKCKGPRSVKQSLHRSFIIARNNFDKLLKQRKRLFQRVLLIDIETCNTQDPRKFWKYIQKLGPRKKV